MDSLLTKRTIARLENRELKWQSVLSEEQFAQLFVGNRIVRASASAPKDAPTLEEGADVYWELEDGRWLAMNARIEHGGYCDTCGYEELRKEYWVLE